MYKTFSSSPKSDYRVDIRSKQEQRSNRVDSVQTRYLYQKWPSDPGEVRTSKRPPDPGAVGTMEWPPDPGAVGTFEWTPDPGGCLGA
jgi:hypothetical protein